MGLSFNTRVMVGGQELLLSVSDKANEEYILKVAENANDRINRIMESNVKMSTLKALAMTCVNLIDELNGVNETADNLREQIKRYIEENSELRAKVRE